VHFKECEEGKRDGTKEMGTISKTSKLQFPILDKIGESVED